MDWASLEVSVCRRYLGMKSPWELIRSLSCLRSRLPLMEADGWYAALCSMKRSHVSKREFF